MVNLDTGLMSGKGIEHSLNHLDGAGREGCLELILNQDLSKLFQLFIKDYPEMVDVVLDTYTPKDDNDVGGYYEFSEDEKGNPVPKIFISAGGVGRFEKLLSEHKRSVEMNVEMLGIKYEDMTGKLFQLFILAHEMGHIRDYKINFLSDSNLSAWQAVEEMGYQRLNVLKMLPVKNVSPSHLRRRLKNIESLDQVLEIFPEVKEYVDFNKIKTVGDLIQAQETEYRQAPPESYADSFAVEFLKKYAEELGLTQLIVKH